MRFWTWWDAVGRQGASPRTAELIHRLLVKADVRGVLHHVAAPVLVLSRLECASSDPGHGRYLTEHLPRALRPRRALVPRGRRWIIEQFTAFTSRHSR